MTRIINNGIVYDVPNEYPSVGKVAGPTPGKIGKAWKKGSKWIPGYDPSPTGPSTGGPTVVAPENTSIPTITGTAQVGVELIGNIGVWTGTGINFTPQYRRDGAIINGANSLNYIPVVSDIGSVITLQVVGSNSAGSDSATSLATLAVIAAAGEGELNPSTLSAPYNLTRTSALLAYPPAFTVEFDDTYNVAESPKVTLIGKNKAGAIIHTFGPHTITLDEATSNPPKIIFPELINVTTGTFRWQTFGSKIGENPSIGSNIVLNGPDDIEPELTLAASTTISSTSGEIRVTTDTPEGTMKYIVNQSAALLGVPAIKSTGTSVPVIIAGEQTYLISECTPETGYYGHLVQTDLAGNDSDEIVTPLFTTLAAPAFSFEVTYQSPSYTDTLTLPNWQNVPIGPADPGRKLIIWVEGYLGGSDAGHCRLNGNADAVKIYSNPNMLTVWEIDFPTGETADFEIGGYASDSRITVASAIGYTSGPTIQAMAQVWTASRTLNVTTPANGKSIIVGVVVQTTGTSAWTGATEISENYGSQVSVGVAEKTAAGSAIVEWTGFGGAESSLTAVSFGS